MKKKYFDGVLLVLLFGPLGLFYTSAVSAFSAVGISLVLMIALGDASFPFIWVLALLMMLSDVHDSRKASG